MSLKYQTLAAIEVLGKLVVDRIPTLRKAIGRAVRKAPKDLEPVTLIELEDQLLSLGISKGDTLMVHSAWDGMRNIQAKPSEVIAMFLELLKPGGTLVMPTGPIPVMRDGFYIYDIDKSPSSLGLISESFRRMPGVRRGSFPMAPVSAIGKLSEHFTRDYGQESGNRPYGLGSPYWQMREHNGEVMIIGIDFIRVLTLSHCAFDVLGEENPIKGFYVEWPFLLINKGKEEKIMIRRPDPKWSSYLASNVFKKMILSAGVSKMANLKGIKITVIDARKFLDWHLEIARKYGWPYWGFPRAYRNQKKSESIQ